jgi:hypothetical protein
VKNRSSSTRPGVSRQHALVNTGAIVKNRRLDEDWLDSETIRFDGLYEFRCVCRRRRYYRCLFPRGRFQWKIGQVEIQQIKSDMGENEQ